MADNEGARRSDLPGTSSALHADLQEDAAMNSASLASRIHSGEAQAEGEFVRLYRSGLVSLLNHWTGSRDLAEDLAQEALLVTIERLREHQLEASSTLAACLRNNAYDLVVSSERRDARQRATVFAAERCEYAEPASDPVAHVERAQEAALTRRLISELAVPRDRELLHRYYVAGESKLQLCIELELDSLHFNRVLHRARQRLRSLFDELKEGR